MMYMCLSLWTMAVNKKIRKLIDLDSKIVTKLSIMAVKSEHGNVKNYIEQVLTDHANKK